MSDVLWLVGGLIVGVIAGVAGVIWWWFHDWRLPL
jgi:hypothetical protein